MKLLREKAGVSLRLNKLKKRTMAGMARNERKRNMDQPARRALDGLADAMASLAAPDSPREPGEFTAEEAGRDCGSSTCTARNCGR